jgi:AraC-like DNA-binding protein
MTTTQPLTSKDFEQHRPHILAKLQDQDVLLQTARGTRLAAVLIQRIFTELFGTARNEEECHRFFVFMAPIFRRLVITQLASVRVGMTSRMEVGDLEQWLSRLGSFDAQCVQMIDLHYFVGLSARHTAQMLGVTPQVVIRDLRFAKAWLQARTRWLPNTTQ